MAPFHNIALIRPATPAADADRHAAVLAEAVKLLHG